MKITAAEVRRIAKLANLDLDKEETDLFTHQLGSILTYVDELRELKTEGVEARSHVLPLATPLRADDTRPSLSAKEALDGAPASEAGHFKVPQVI